MDRLDYSLILIIVALIVMHIGIIFIASLNKFLVAENIVLATLYATSVAGILRKRSWGYSLAVVVALFSAGRVSRSIVGSSGEIGRLAVEHIPLLLVDLLVGLLALIRLQKQ